MQSSHAVMRESPGPSLRYSLAWKVPMVALQSAGKWEKGRGCFFFSITFQNSYLWASGPSYTPPHPGSLPGPGQVLSPQPLELINCARHMSNSRRREVVVALTSRGGRTFWDDRKGRLQVARGPQALPALTSIARAQRSSAGRFLPTCELGAALASNRGDVRTQGGVTRVDGAAEQLGFRPIYLGVPHQLISCLAGTF